MRKSILLLSGVGIGAGLLYALTSNSGKRNGKGLEGENESTERAAKASGNGQNGQSASAGSKSPLSDANTSNKGVGRAVGSSMKNQSDENAQHEAEPEIDDRGTDQHEASQILKNVRDAAFDASDEKLAVALGRPTEEIEAFTSGSETIDGDALMKARALAIARGVEIQ